MKVIVTGASGVLGRAVANHFASQPSTTVVPLSFSRTTHSQPNLPPYTPLDLLSTPAVEEFFASEKAQGADWLIHCAAERRPDVADADPERAERLNVGVVKNLAGLCGKNGIGMIYISTDYVFDGTAAPYLPSAKPNPLNFYGKTKRAGEVAVLEAREEQGDKTGKSASVLRIPVLYGQVEYNAETAVNILVDIVEDQSGKQYKMDHFGVRFPTCTEDVARVIYELCALDRPLPAILHYSAQRPFTKYEMCQLFGKYLSLPIDHIAPDTTDPNVAAEQAKKEGKPFTIRPGNTLLSVKETEELIGADKVKEAKTFEEWWQAWAEENKKTKA